MIFHISHVDAVRVSGALLRAPLLAKSLFLTVDLLVFHKSSTGGQTVQPLLGSRPRVVLTVAAVADDEELLRGSLPSVLDLVPLVR